MGSSTPVRNSSALREALMTGQYSDFVLAFGVVAIVGLMILPLPLLVIDILVAVNILISVSLVLLSIYVPSPLAFASFPSVILLSTLFRLSLSIAITRLILLDADAGHIIESFGNMVVGGNLVVGIVVFLIITVVQFIVIAKGAERVAEVAARFTLDAMPGKQLSIDSDLRAGLIDKEDARSKRRLLERESQLHGSLDGAMKFVKGDAIAGIVILIVNILGGLAVGVLQNDLSLSEAVHTYSVLTIGDGLVSQVPALLTSIAAGLIITRTGGDASESHLGSAIGRQFSAFPRVFVIGGILALVLTLVPGFPWPVFLSLGIILLAWSAWKNPHPFLQHAFPRLGRASRREKEAAALKDIQPQLISPLATVELRVSPLLFEEFGKIELQGAMTDVINEMRLMYGVPIPLASVVVDGLLTECSYELMSYGVRLAKGRLRSGQVFTLDQGRFNTPTRLMKEAKSSTENLLTDFSPELQGFWQHKDKNVSSPDRHSSEINALSPTDTLAMHCRMTLVRYLPTFLGIQEVSDMVNHWANHYPDLIKETLRVIPPQRLTEILKRLLKEAVSIRNLRDIFETIADAGNREKDLDVLTEMVRQGLKQQLSHCYADEKYQLKAVLVHPDLEDSVRQLCRDQQATQPVSMTPETYVQISSQLLQFLNGSDPSSRPLVLLCSADIRRYIRRLIEDDFSVMPVLAYQELVGNVQIIPTGQLRA